MRSGHSVRRSSRSSIRGTGSRENGDVFGRGGNVCYRDRVRIGKLVLVAALTFGSRECPARSEPSARGNQDIGGCNACATAHCSTRNSKFPPDAGPANSLLPEVDAGRSFSRRPDSEFGGTEILGRRKRNSPGTRIWSICIAFNLDIPEGVTTLRCVARFSDFARRDRQSISAHPAQRSFSF